MGLDIRWPIGLMFSLVGILMTGFGFVTRNDAAMYRRSLDINIGAAVDRTLAGAFAQMPRWVQPAALPFGVAGQPFGAVNFFRN